MIQRARIIRRVILVVCCACLPTGVARPAHGQDVLKNQDVIEMTQAKVAPTVIVSTIESSRSSFAVAVADIVALSNAKVAADVIKAMQAAVARGGQPVQGMGASEPSLPLPTEFGIYVVQDGQPSPLPEGTTSTMNWRDPRGGFRVYHIANYDRLERKEVPEEQPTFIVFQPGGDGEPQPDREQRAQVQRPQPDRVQRAQRPQVTRRPREPQEKVRSASAPTVSAPAPYAERPRIRLFEARAGQIDESQLREIPLRIGAAGQDARMVTVTPERPLARGFYFFVMGSNFTRGYGFGRVEGERGIPTLSAQAAMSLVRGSGAFVIPSTISPDAAKAIILAVISRERIVVEKDFDDNGLLLTTRALRGTGFLGTPVAVQFVVLVRGTSTGSEVRVAADAYVAGNASGLLDAESLENTPLLSSREESRWRAEGLTRDFRREIQRAR